MHKWQVRRSLPTLVVLYKVLHFPLPTLKTKYEFVGLWASFCSALTVVSCDSRYKPQHLALPLLGNPAQGHNLQTCTTTTAYDQSWNTTCPSSTGHPDPKHTMQASDSHSNWSKIIFCTYVYSLTFKDE